VATNLIFGGLGQDGRLLSEFLISQNQKVIAVVRESNPLIEVPGVLYVVADKIEIERYYAIISNYKPEIVYNLASMSSVAKCEELPGISLELNFELVKAIVDAIKLYLFENNSIEIKLIQAGSSEMFGSSEYPINELSIMRPKSTYGLHKKYSFDFLESIKGTIPNLQISNLILFNHESILRQENFVSQKIAIASALWKLKGVHSIRFGNINMARDWGCALEYVRAMKWVGDQKQNENYVIASGNLTKVSQILDHAMHYAGFKGDDFLPYLDRSLLRENETAPLVGNPTKIHKAMGWEANRSIYSVIEEMIDFQISRLKEK
jgi:GDPmannose 4,6-dehydratase